MSLTRKDKLLIGFTAAFSAASIGSANHDVRAKVSEMFSDKADAHVGIAAGSQHMPCAAGEIVYGVTTNKPIIAITIDDGPSPETTRQNIAVAKKHGAVVTFFFIAERMQSAEGAELAKEALAAGQEVAVHSYRHILGEPNTNAAETNVANDTFLHALGYIPYAQRAPGLAYSAQYTQTVMSSKQCFIDVSADTKDWQCDFSPAEAAKVGIQNRISALALKPGDIVLMHDEMTDDPLNGGRERHRITSPFELDLLLTKVESMGMSSVSVSTLLQEGDHIQTLAPNNDQSKC